MMGKRVKWWLGLLLVIGGVWFSAARPVAASSDVDAVVQRTGERNHYQLQVANLKNQTLRDLNIKVRFAGPKVKRGTVMTWHVAKLGATPRTSVPFTVSQTGTVTAGKAGVAVSRTGYWLAWAGGGVAALVLIGGAWYLWRRKRLGAGGAVIILIAGTLASTAMLRPAAAAAATQRANLTQRITVGGTLTTVTTTIRYQRAGDKLVAFGGQLAKHPRQRLTFLDSSTGQRLRVRTDRTGHFQTRLNASHPYEVSGDGGSFAVEPSSIGMRVTQQRGLTVTPATIASNHITTTLKPAVQELPTGTRHPTVNATRKTVTVPGLRADLRQGDLVIVPPTGYYYGGIAIRVTSIQRNPQADTTTLGVAQPTLKQVVNTVKGTNTVNTERAVFIPSVPSATTGTAVSPTGMQKTGWLEYDRAESLEASHKLEFDLAPLIKGLAVADPKLKPLAQHLDGSLTLEMKDTVDTDIDLNLGWQPHAKLKVANTLSLNDKYEATWPKKDANGDRPELKLKPIPLGYVPIPIGGALSVRVELALTISASGTISVNYTQDFHRTDTVNFNSAHKKKMTRTTTGDTTNSLGFKLEGEVKAGIAPITDLQTLGLTTLDVKPEAGVKLVGTFSGDFKDNSLSPDEKTEEKSLALKRYAELVIDIPVAKWFGSKVSWTPVSVEDTIAKWPSGEAVEKPKEKNQPRRKHQPQSKNLFPLSWQNRKWYSTDRYMPKVWEFGPDYMKYDGHKNMVHSVEDYTAAEKKWFNSGDWAKPPIKSRMAWESIGWLTDTDGIKWLNTRGWYQTAGDGTFYRIGTELINGKRVQVLFQASGAGLWTDGHAYPTQALAQSQQNKMYSDDHKQE